jgi:hypothetical protein
MVITASYDKSIKLWRPQASVDEAEHTSMEE